jgi:hypothetical protein
MASRLRGRTPSDPAVDFEAFDAANAVTPSGHCGIVFVRLRAPAALAG